MHLDHSKVVGVDLSNAALTKAVSRGFSVVQADLNEGGLPFKDASFDSVLCTEVIEHIWNTDFLLLEIRRVLRPEATLVLSTPNIAAWYNRILLLLGLQPIGVEVSTRRVYHLTYARGQASNPASGIPVGHIRYFTPGSLRKFLEDSGFHTELSACAPLDHFPFPRLDHIFAKSSRLGSVLVVRARKEGT